MMAWLPSGWQPEALDASVRVTMHHGGFGRALLLAALCLVTGALAACGDGRVGFDVSLDDVSMESDAPIIGGAGIDRRSFPATGGLLVVTESDEGTRTRLRCTGTLVAADVVLLAAHCLATAPEIDTSYIFSLAEDLTEYADVEGEVPLPPASFAVASVVQHPDFDLAALEDGAGDTIGLGTFDDIGVAFLSERSDVAPEVVALAADGERLRRGTEVLIVGYGASSPFIDDRGRKRRAASSVTELAPTEMLIGEPDPVARKCVGDSGGPTFATVDDGLFPVRRIVGVTSHAYDATGCATGGVDTRVHTYRGWLDDTLRLACGLAHRPACSGDGGLPLPTASRREIPDTRGGCAASPAGAWPLVLVLGGMASRVARAFSLRRRVVTRSARAKVTAGPWPAPH